MKRAVVYLRISQDRDGEALGVARQEKDCAKLCASHGWTIVETLTDNDLSAYSGKPRPGYRRLLHMIENGLVDVVVAWHPDRLHRSPVELEHFVELVECGDVAVETCTGGRVDLSTPTGRMSARMLGAAARFESEHKSERIRRKHLELAEAGKIAGGGRRPFGFEADRLTVRPDEAALIVEAADRVEAGESVRSIVRHWNDLGVPTVTGTQWSPTTVKRLLCSARISGRREHHGRITGRAVWPQIISPEQSDVLRSQLGERAAPTSHRDSWRYLLGGLVHCGDCGARMSSRPANGRPRYSCVRDRHGGCNRCSIDAIHTEGFVVAALHEALRTDRLPVADRPRLVIDRRQLAADEQALADLARDRYVDRTITDGEYRAARAPLEERIARAQALLAAEHARSAVLVAGGVEAVIAGWDELPFGQRRAIAAEIIDRIEVAPVGRGGRFRPERLTLTWRR